ncbi:MAG: hypothetical protein O8C59_05925 [Candidatus Methanoperedens sp.]|nr:hypothetical protein [Candidatus Methanoperedens sp.]MCZ7398022.1 hypothetical protein [Candidatus Methanoperedens sp.]
MGSINKYMKEIYIIVAAVSIIFFLFAGYAYPATAEDIAKNKAFPFNGNGKYDRGMFTQFFTSLAFTAAVLLLGFYVNSTFVKFGVKNWPIFAIGVFMMLLYGVGKIGELTYDHELFDAFKDLTLPLALMVMAYATHKIYNDVKGGRKNVSQ